MNLRLPINKQRTRRRRKTVVAVSSWQRKLLSSSWYTTLISMLWIPAPVASKNVCACRMKEKHKDRKTEKDTYIIINVKYNVLNSSMMVLFFCGATAYWNRAILTWFMHSTALIYADFPCRCSLLWHNGTFARFIMPVHIRYVLSHFVYVFSWYIVSFIRQINYCFDIFCWEQEKIILTAI